MAIYFNANNLLNKNSITDCKCSITKKSVVGNTVFAKTETKQVKSIWGNNNGDITKIWERDNESLPQFLMLGIRKLNQANNYYGNEATTIGMYTSDDLANWTTLGTCYSTKYTSNINDDCRVYSEKYIGSMDGTYFASVLSKSSGDTIGKLSKVSDAWKWLPWSKTKEFTAPSLAGIFSIENRPVIFINAKLSSEQAEKHLYFSVNSGNTWAELINREITQILDLNGRLIFYGNGIFSFLDCENIDGWTSELVTNSYPGSDFPTNPLIIATDSRLMVYKDSTGYGGVFVSYDNGTTWNKNTISNTSSTNWLKNEIVSTAHGHGMTFTNMYKFDSRNSQKNYYLYQSTDGINWNQYPSLSAVTNTFIGESGKRVNQRNLYYFDSVDKFVCTGVYNNTTPIIYVISIGSNDTLSYKMNFVAEENPRIIQNRY